VVKHLVDEDLQLFCIDRSCVLHEHQEVLGLSGIAGMLGNACVLHPHSLAQLLSGVGIQPFCSELQGFLVVRACHSHETKVPGAPVHQVLVQLFVGVTLTLWQRWSRWTSTNCEICRLERVYVRRNKGIIDACLELT